MTQSANEIYPWKKDGRCIFLVRKTIEKYKIDERKLYMVFADLEKAFDCVSRRVIWWILKRKKIGEREVKAFMKMCDGTKTVVRSEDGRVE